MIERQIGRDAAGRVAVDVAGLGLGFAGSLVLARELGAAGVGSLASLTFAAIVLGRLASLGLGEAAVLLVQKERVPLHRVTIALARPVAAGSVTAGVLLIGLAAAGIVGDAPVSAIGITALAAALVTSQRVVSLAAVAGGRLEIATAARLAASVVEVGIVAACAAVSDLDLVAALAAFAAGVLASLAIPWRAMRPAVRGGRDRELVRRSLRLGVPQEVSYLLIALTGRLDLLIVLAVLGRAEAGRYSVALTLGQLVATIPLATAWAAYPKLAALDGTAQRALAGRTFRAGLLAAVAGALGLVAIIPVAVPMAYGSEFRGAVGPAIVLVIAGVPTSALWLLVRTRTAAGHPHLQVQWAAATLVVMLAADAVLVPRFGLGGASAAAALGSLAGVAVYARFHAAERRQSIESLISQGAA